MNLGASTNSHISFKSALLLTVISFPLVLSPEYANAGLIHESGTPIIFPWITPLSLFCFLFSIVIGNDELTAITFEVDPLNIKSFSLDFQFDPNVLNYYSIQYVSPYTQVGSPDLSMLGSGPIQDISGTIEVPPSGDVNLFEVTFTFKSGVSNTPATVFASAIDYVVGY